MKTKRPRAIWFVVAILVALTTLVLWISYAFDSGSVLNTEVNEHHWSETVYDIAWLASTQVSWIAVIILVMFRIRWSRWLLLISGLSFSALMIELVVASTASATPDDDVIATWLGFTATCIAFLTPLFIAVRLLFLGKGVDEYFAYPTEGSELADRPTQ